MKLRMIARSVGNGNNRAVVGLQVVRDYTNDKAPDGSANIIINDPDETDAFVEGLFYDVTFTRAAQKAGNASWDSQPVKPPHIKNSTNTRHYVTPPEMKVPPPVMPDGTVTEPRPSVVLPPLEGSPPPTVGVVSGPPDPDEKG